MGALERTALGAVVGPLGDDEAAFRAMAGVSWLAHASLYLGLALGFASAAQYVRDMRRQQRALAAEKPSS